MYLADEDVNKTSTQRRGTHYNVPDRNSFSSSAADTVVGSLLYGTLGVISLSGIFVVVQVWLRQKYNAPQDQSNQGLNPWPPDDEQHISCSWNAVVITTQPSGTPYQHHKIMWPSIITRLTGHFTCALCLIWWFATIKRVTWHPMYSLRLGVVNHQTRLFHWVGVLTKIRYWGI